jgi:hypothetical protein
MKASEVISTARRWLNDEVEPYKWTTSELIDYLNEAMDIVAQKADALFGSDPSTMTAASTIAVVAGTNFYAYDDRILAIDSVKLVTSEKYLDRISFEEAELTYGTGWLSTAAADRDEPSNYILDYRVGYIYLVACPETSESMILNMRRRQFTPITSALLATTDIPLFGEFHLRMAHGVCWRAFIKGGTATFKPEYAASHKLLFGEVIEDIKRMLLKLLYRRRVIKAKWGNI